MRALRNTTTEPAPGYIITGPHPSDGKSKRWQLLRRTPSGFVFVAQLDSYEALAARAQHRVSR